MTNKIKNIIVAISNKCNLQCKMCTIWKEKNKIDLDVNTFSKIFKSHCLDENFSLTITGGEPFLSKKFHKIIDVIIKNRPEALKTISTNGVFTNNIVSFLRDYKSKLPNLSISISFDGLNRNDEQRGKSKSNILETIREIRNLFPEMRLKLKFTITPFNYDDILPTYEFCKNIGVEFKIKISESAENYTNKLGPWTPIWSNGVKLKTIKNLVTLRDEFFVTNKSGADFIMRTIAALNGKYHLKECRAPFDRIFVMPNGIVYSCIHLNSIGNLKESSLDEIYLSKSAKDNQTLVMRKECKGCVSFHGSG
ncbi:radical SAM protein [Candidatus Woesearchaeota archaeon]|nr:radical SAM protein [Candidatus Woesearchaeota archaeon]